MDSKRTIWLEKSGGFLAIDLTNKPILDLIHESAHTIMDHGFAELSYKGVLEDNIDTFKQKYKVYHANER